MQDSQDTEREAFSSKHSSQPRFLPDKFKGFTERVVAPPGVKDIYPQIIASCFSQMLVIQAGINMAYSAILLPQLMADDSPFSIDTDQASWIASLMAISTPVGALMCGPFMDQMGRKRFSVVATIPITASWFLLVFMPNSVWPFYVARILAGFGGGLTTVGLVYISEISDSSWRPMLLCLNSVFVSLGILLTNFLGVLLPWRIVALFSGCLSLATALAITLYNPESPYWLLNFRSDSDKHFEQAKQSLRHLYPNQQMFSKEWERLVAVSREKRSEDGKVGINHTLAEFTKRSSLLPLTLILVIFLLQQLSGIYPIIFYAVQVFQSVGGDLGGGLSADTATILLGVIRFVMSLLTAGLSRTFGRRQLLMVSGIGMTISSFAAAVYFHQSCVFINVFNKNQSSTSILNSTSVSTNFAEGNSTLPLASGGETGGISNLIGLICILLFVTMSSIGFLIIPWTLIGEILPMSIRGTGGGIVCSYSYILMFGIVKVFPFMLDIFHISGLFYFFSFTSLANAIVVYFFLPETLGKSFEEIEKSFTKSYTSTK